ncbi:hypothetical protein ACFLRX_05635 [Acidobacteriota bacterium]
MGDKVKQYICDFFDFLMPELTPGESSLYLYLLRNTVLIGESRDIRVGKRTIAKGYGAGSRGEKTNFAHITKLLKS